MDATQIDQQDAADGAVDEAEAARELAVEMIVGDRSPDRMRTRSAPGRPSGRPGSPARAAPARGRSVRDSCVVSAPANLMRMPPRRPSRRFFSKSSPTAPLAASTLSVNRQAVAVADENAAHRIGRGRSVLVDLVGDDDGGLDHGERDASASDHLGDGKHGGRERVLQVVVDAIARNRQVAQRVRGVQQRREGQVEDGGVDVGEQRALGVVCRRSRPVRRPGRRRNAGRSRCPTAPSSRSRCPRSRSRGGSRVSCWRRHSGPGPR